MLSTQTGRKHVIFDNLLHFMALVDVLPEEDIREIMCSLRSAHCEESEPEAFKLISALEEFALREFENNNQQS